MRCLPVLALISLLYMGLASRIAQVNGINIAIIVTAVKTRSVLLIQD